MAAHNIEVLDLNVINSIQTETEEEFSIPLDISDLITICKEFNNLGWQMQNQMENILDIGVEASIKSGYVKKQSLPHIKNFLQVICQNPYFGDATFQAKECISLINEYCGANVISISN